MIYIKYSGGVRLDNNEKAIVEVTNSERRTIEELANCGIEKLSNSEIIGYLNFITIQD